MDNRFQQNFDSLIFDKDSHSYSLDGKPLTPVTTLIKDFIPEFDKSKAKKVAARRGISEQQVLEEWEEIRINSINHGNQIHEFAYHYGKYFVEGGDKPPLTSLEEVAVAKFFNDLPKKYLPIAFEQKMYSRKYGYGGIADLILFDGKKGFIIVDYKTSKDIHKNYDNQMMYTPFQYLLDTPFNHYQLQLSLYQMSLQEAGFLVTERWVIWIKSDGTYQKLLANDFSSILKQHISA